MNGHFSARGIAPDFPMKLLRKQHNPRILNQRQVKVKSDKATVSWPKLLLRGKYFCLRKEDSLIWTTKQNCVTSFVNEAPSSAYSRANWD